MDKMLLFVVEGDIIWRKVFGAKMVFWRGILRVLV